MKIVKSIVIVGGGTAGWFSALSILNKLPEIHVSLIEDPSNLFKGIEGESLTPSTVKFLRNFLNLGTDSEWLKASDGTYKVGGKFQGWAEKDFWIVQNVLSNIKSDKRSWCAKKAAIPGTGLDDCYKSVYPGVHLLETGKISKELLKDWDNNDWSVHLNTTKLNTHIKGKCLKLGLSYIPSKVEKVHTYSNTIKEVTLDSGETLTADLFIDCTGGARTLINSLDNQLIDYSDTFINNEAIFFKRPIESEDTIPLYTLAKTAKNGWIWEIPLKSATNIGYIYSTKYESRDKSLEEFIKEYPEAEDLEISHIKGLKPGRLDKSWVGNCVAIGQSYGFIDPLEANAIWSITNQVSVLLRFISMSGSYSPLTSSSYNIAVAKSFEGVREFLELHFISCYRNDSSYWKHFTEKVVPSSTANTFIYDIMENGSKFSKDGFFNVDLLFQLALGANITDAELWISDIMNKGDTINNIDEITSHMEGKASMFDILYKSNLREHKDILNKLYEE
jgi:tryptophan halogenase